MFWTINSGDHYSYTGHNCPVALKRDVQVPVCPLCNAPVPGKLDELPDIRVGRHIDNDCKSDTAKDRRNVSHFILISWLVKQVNSFNILCSTQLQKVYSNRCTFKTCKKKEMIPVLCDSCNLNFCLKHRHPQDHECTNKRSGNERQIGKAGQAALARTSSSQSNSQSFSTRVSNATSSAASGLSRAMGFRQATTVQQGHLVNICI